MGRAELEALFRQFAGFTTDGVKVTPVEKVGPQWSVQHKALNRAQRREIKKVHGFMPRATNKPVRRADSASTAKHGKGNP